MGLVGAGIFKMINRPSKAVSSVHLTEQEIRLAMAYTHSASQDKLMASEFEHAIGDGLMGEDVFLSPLDATGSGSEFRNFPQKRFTSAIK